MSAGPDPAGPPSASRLRKNARFVFRALVSASMIWFVFRRLDWASVGAILAHADWRYLAVASVLTMLPVFLLAARWQIFVRQQGISVSGKCVFFLTWAGQFFNTVLPGNTGGDFVKIFHLCRIAPDHKAGAVASVVIDRLTALAALLALAACALVRQPIPDLLAGWSLPAWVPVAAAGLALAAAVAGFALWSRLRVRERIGGFIAAMKVGARPGVPLAAGLALALAIHLFSFFLFYLFSRALGFSITYSDTLIFLPVLLTLMLLPVTVNGHGLREIVLIYYFQTLHIFPTAGGPGGAAEFVVSLSLVTVANELLWSLPGGIVYMLRFRGIR